MTRLLAPQAHLAIADPSPADYRDLPRLAQAHGWHIHFLTNARAAVQFARRMAADVWVVNAHLPDMEGTKLVGLLRETAATAPVVVVSDRYDADDERRACRQGAALFTCKDGAGGIACEPLFASLVLRNRHGPRRGATRLAH